MTLPEPIHPNTDTSDSATAPVAQEALGETALASYLSAKLCHDFISPAGAIVSGLDLLKDPAAQDMRDDALSLIDASAQKLVQIVHFARVAYGAATTSERFDAGELKKLVEDAFSQMRAALVWNVQLPVFEKPVARAFLNLAQIGGHALPMGGEATISASQEDDTVVMSAACNGPRARLKAEMITGLKGEQLNEGLAGQWIQGFWLSCVVREAGGVLTLDVGDESVSISVRMPA
ncbi:MAG: histidine phosphotransferase [Caulobacteraceae bacterium]|nr:histidine phosphotransferase [Caulobacteraceae bacterium]